MWKNLRTKLFGSVLQKNRFRIDYRVQHLDHLGCYVVWDEGEIMHVTTDDSPNPDLVIQQIRNRFQSVDRINQIMNSQKLDKATLNYTYNFTKETAE